MPTRNEQRALIFIAGVLVLGASVRVVRAARGAPSAADSAALARQRTAADSARDFDRAKKSRKGAHATRVTRNRVTRDTVPPSSTARSRAPLDIDRATAAQIESLPGVGPVLAKRIVADRDAHGPFGSLVALQEVRGIGSATAKRLDSLVTFSGPPRPPSATPVEASTRSTPRRARREPRPFPALRDSAHRKARRRSGSDTTSPAAAKRSRASPFSRNSTQWPHPPQPPSASEISSFVRGSSLESSSRWRSTSSARTARASATTS